MNKTFAINRRSVLKLMGAACAVPYGIGRAFAQDAKPLTVGVIYPGSKEDYGYNKSHASAAAQLKALPGVTVIEEERVPETVAVQRTMEGMIQQDGANLIIATSFGYFKPHVQQIAAKYPDVMFAHCGGVWDETMPTNIGTFYAYIYSAQYVSGIVAAHMTKTKKLGVVAAKPTPNLIRSINAFAIAARSVDPSITVQVIFTGDWVLPVREAESTNSLVDQGADVIACHVDSPKVVVETAEKRGVYSCGYHSSQADIAPKGFLTGAEWNWFTPYSNFVDAARNGNPPVHYLRGGFAENFIKNTPFGSAVAADARAAAEKAQAALVSRNLSIYAGPLKDNNGNVVIPQGTSLAENDHRLDKIDYRVDGVIGQK
ncbi:BMP family ABC transporter substrate-binding protein [Bradyrhizobium sp. BRP14]|nr:BMP family ABC transporter substrate-binding protein [Bradyrhizobium sp. BRP14]